MSQSDDRDAEITIKLKITPIDAISSRDNQNAQLSLDSSLDDGKASNDGNKIGIHSIKQSEVSDGRKLFKVV